MNWGAYFSLFSLSTIKFLFAPFAGPYAQLSFLETYFSCVAGALISASIFYFASEYFIERAQKKRLANYRNALQKGQIPKVKKNFTRANKFIVHIKKRFGIYGISLYAPLFLSVPIGSIITAKFYGRDKRTFPLIVFGMFLNGAITTSLAYFVFS
ncbi:MAG: hypothetical protein EP338_10150 [Bacteroidetes bacterium]|nr:MAG: hypothetical protein EP338_10150 [Bacteroidota bacterium]